MVDAHQHFWNRNEISYYWLTPECGVLYRDFQPGDLFPLITAAGVEKTVVVQATSSMKEAEWLLKQAVENDFIGGVVTWVDLADPNLAAILKTLKENPKFKGVRHQIEDEKDPKWILRPEILSGLKTVAASGVTFDALMKKEQLWQLEEVFDVAPTLRVVIDHCAKPDIAHNEFDGWATYMDNVARLPVSCKLSGLFTETKAGGNEEDVRPYSDYVLEVFGEDRVMFGSDWPVSTQVSDYCNTVEMTKKLLSDLDDVGRKKVLDLNARRFYGI